MSSILPVNLDALLHCRGVESERVEFKASWDTVATGPQVLRTICAFANDYHNLNGGYVVIGVAERAGRPVLPPAGLSENDVDAAGAEHERPDNLLARVGVWSQLSALRPGVPCGRLAPSPNGAV